MSKEATETAKQAGKFGIVGISNTVIDIGLFNLLTGLFGMYVVWANTISVTAAIINSYIWNKNWTFKDKASKNLLAQFVKFVLFSLVGMGIQNVVVWGLATKWTVSGEFVFRIVELLRVNSLLGFITESFTINNWAKVWGIALALVWNFFAYKKWTFNK